MSKMFDDSDGTSFMFRKYPMIGEGGEYPETSGVYIMAKETAPVYIGQSENLKKWLVPGHKKLECAKKQGADAIYILEAPKEELEKRVRDLIYNYEPFCNGE